jgi:methionyl aminopeptidase
MAIIIKSPEQIEGIRKSCQLAADTLDYLEQFVKLGVTTQQINDEAEKFIRSHGAIPAPLGYHGFPKAVCTSMNEVICHGIPNSEDVLEEGDIINVDVTTILNGYFGDTCRMYTVGEISNEAKELLSVARDCLEIGIAQVRPGSKFGNIGKAISDYARSRGYSVVHQFCGHGVGLKFHEEPQVHHDDRQFMDIEMKPGMIFTIEPMINAGVAEAVIDSRDKWTARTKDGKLSAQYEHTVLVTDSGVEILTKSTAQLLKMAW